MLFKLCGISVADDFLEVDFIVLVFLNENLGGFS
jgi:hypothetical protein